MPWRAGLDGGVHLGDLSLADEIADRGVPIMISWRTDALFFS